METLESYRVAAGAAIIAVALAWQFRERIAGWFLPRPEPAPDPKLNAFADAISLEKYFSTTGNVAGIMAVRSVFAALCDGGDQ